MLLRAKPGWTTAEGHHPTADLLCVSGRLASNVVTWTDKTSMGVPQSLLQVHSQPAARDACAPAVF